MNSYPSFIPNYSRALDYTINQDSYKPTPLETYKLSSKVSLQIKNESNRLGLGSFKALGGPYAVMQLILEGWYENFGKHLSLHELENRDIQDYIKGQQFVCASAGNHGIGVAAGAKKVGATAWVFLSKTVPIEFEQKLIALGAKTMRAGNNYDESVEAAQSYAEKLGATLLADGSWPGYTEIPKLVMEGYTVIAEELRQSYVNSDQWPTHVFLQAGVGGLAAALAWMIRHNWSVQPEIIIVEPDFAACLRDSHLAGKVVKAIGPDSDMGRLDCKLPSLVAWETLESCNVSYIAISDIEGTKAAKRLSSLGFPTTSSGAAGLAGVEKFLEHNSQNETVTPLIIITEEAGQN